MPILTTTTNVTANEGRSTYCLNLLSSLQPVQGEELLFMNGDTQVSVNKQLFSFLSPFTSQLLQQVTSDCFFCSKDQIYISLPQEVSTEAIHALKNILETGEAGNLVESIVQEVKDTLELLGTNITLETVPEDDGRRDSGNFILDDVGSDDIKIEPTLDDSFNIDIKIENSFSIEVHQDEDVEFIAKEAAMSDSIENEISNCAHAEDGNAIHDCAGLAALLRR